MKISREVSNTIIKNILTGRRIIFYGWVVVAACILIQTMQYGIQYSFGIFFKPILTDFGWSRAATSGAYSVAMIAAGASAIPSGWLADRFGPVRVTVVSGLLTGLALVLTSRISELWQLYLTFGVMQGVAIGGTMAITSGVTTRWFVKKRGLALGIVSAAIGLGTLVGPPVSERLIAAFGWSQACVFIGLASGIIIIGSALLLKSNPESAGLLPYGLDAKSPDSITEIKKLTRSPDAKSGLSLRSAIHTGPLWTLTVLFFLINICVQVIMVHIVNYSTDLGIDAFIAATIMSVIGIGSIAGRLVMGSAADKIGGDNSLIITSLALLASLTWLIFSHQLWMLYVFAVFYSFSYGGELPQMGLLVSEFYGLRAVMALVGVISVGIRIGGALGSWAAGEIFDLTNSYFLAFVITAAVALLALIIALTLKKIKVNFSRSSKQPDFF